MLHFDSKNIFKNYCCVKNVYPILIKLGGNFLTAITPLIDFYSQLREIKKTEVKRLSKI